MYHDETYDINRQHRFSHIYLSDAKLNNIRNRNISCSNISIRLLNISYRPLALRTRPHVSLTDSCATRFTSK